jgi:hypothetical protein
VQEQAFRAKQEADSKAFEDQLKADRRRCENDDGTDGEDE